MVNPLERTRAFLRERTLTTGRRVDAYLTQNLPRLAREYELATANNIAPIDGRLTKQRMEAERLEAWRFEARERVDRIARRVTRLEVQNAAGGGKE